MTVLGCEAGAEVTGRRGEERTAVDSAAATGDPDAYDALVIPGGQSPDHLRADPGVVAFVRRFCASGRPVAALCQGAQLLIEADAVRGRRLTSWPSVRTDLVNAGATWIDQPVVTDGALITSRMPDDLEELASTLLAAL